MKKLLITTLATIFAVALHAASVEWSLGGVIAPASATITTEQIYAFESTAITQQQVLDLFLAGDVASITAAGYVASDYDSGEAEGIVPGYGNKADTSTFLAIFDQATLADSQNLFISEIEASVTGGNGQSAYPEFDVSAYATAAFDSSTFTTGGWYAVPEPTSGLLLLVGGALLALKRRRA